MNSAQIKGLAIFFVFAVIGFGPVSPGCLICMYIVMERPPWFLAFAARLYAVDNAFQEDLGAAHEKRTKSARIKCFMSLLGLFILDIAPLPTTPMIAIFVIVTRPRWFMRSVASVYGKVLGV